MDRIGTGPVEDRSEVKRRVFLVTVLLYKPATVKVVPALEGRW